MAHLLFNILKEFGIENKVWPLTHTSAATIDLPPLSKLLDIVLDNASSNDTFVDELARLLPGVFTGQAQRTCCFLHITNLCARATLSPFEPPRSKASAPGPGPLDIYGDDEPIPWPPVIPAENNNDNEDTPNRRTPGPVLEPEDELDEEEEDHDEIEEEIAHLSALDAQTLRDTGFPVRMTLQKVKTQYEYMCCWS